jgi:imidazolonepropionase-like amidohydrolase
MDIVIEKDRITHIRSVGYPELAIDETRRPRANPGDKVLDLTGMYVLPGLVDMHGHIGGDRQGTPAEYVLKLWMAHGITTIRDPGSGNGVDWTLEHKARSSKNEITGPRIEVYARFGLGHKGTISTPEQARAWVSEMAQKGADGLKLSSHPPEIMAATIDEARKRGLRTGAHLSQMGVAGMNVLNAARLGLTTMEHWYGLPESLSQTARCRSSLPAITTTTNRTVSARPAACGSKPPRPIASVGMQS